MQNNRGRKQLVEIIKDSLTYSATDLVGFLECQHLTGLERAALSGHQERPERTDLVLDRIAQRGQLHERRFLWSLHSHGLQTVELELDSSRPRSERPAKGRDDSLRAMQTGVDVIYQAVLFDATAGARRFPAPRRTPQRSRQMELRGLGHQAGPSRQGLRRPAALHVLRPATRIPGAPTLRNAPRPRRREGRDGLIPSRRIRRVLPHGRT